MEKFSVKILAQEPTCLPNSAHQALPNEDKSIWWPPKTL